MRQVISLLMGLKKKYVCKLAAPLQTLLNIFFRPRAFQLWQLSDFFSADLLGLQKLPVKFPLLDQLLPAAHSLQLAEQRGQTTVLQAQLVHLLLLAEQVEHVR